MIRVLVVDDHPAVRSGLSAVLRLEPGLVLVGACSTVRDALFEAERQSPDVAVVDYHLGDPEGDGLDVCMRLRRRGTRTLIYSAYSGRALAAAAQVAGASGLLHKAAGGDELCDAVRWVARGQARFPQADDEVLASFASRIEPEDVPVLGIMLHTNSPEDAAEALRLDRAELDRRLRRMLERLRPPTPRFLQ